MKTIARVHSLRESDYNFNTWFRGEYKEDFKNIVALTFPKPTDFVCNHCSIQSIAGEHIKSSFPEYPEFRKCSDHENVIRIIALIDSNYSGTQMEIDVEYTKFSIEDRQIELLGLLKYHADVIEKIKQELKQIQENQ